MKSPHLFLFAASLFALTSVARAGESGPVVAYSATQTGPAEVDAQSVKRGHSRDDVVTRIGLPDRRLSPDIWVYWDYRCSDRAATQRGYDTLIVTFARDRVADMKIVNAQALAPLLARKNDGALAAQIPSPR